MFRRELDNKAVDAIGRKLVENDLLSVDEIDRIIDRSDLFDKVNRRIAAIEHDFPAAKVRKTRSWLPAAAGSFASLVILAVIATAVISRNNVGTTIPAVTYVQVPDAVPEIARPDVPPKPVVIEKLSAGRAENLGSGDLVVERASFRRRAAKPSVVKNSVPVNKAEPAFFPVAYTGDPAETAGGGRIIRVNLDRSSLFALGVNMPLENDVAVVKADLLVGMDGVTRAVRLVE